MKKLIFFLIPVLTSVLFCQTFTDIGAMLTGVSNSSVAWGDYDNDGDMDVLVTGYSGTARIAKIYNNDHGVFTEIAAGLTGVDLSSAAWGDYDGDGDLDLLITGYADNPPFYSSKIYRNDSGSFTDINAGLTGVQSGSVAWGDYDNDGDLDILLTGYYYTGTANYAAFVYRNDEGIFTDIAAGLPGVRDGSSAFADYDNDGDLDILLTGHTGTANISRIYTNDSGTFSDLNAGLPGVRYGSVAWGDYDNDGDQDILITGDTGSVYISRIYNNDSGVFTDITAGLTGVRYSSVAWGDCDNDGDLDILLTGSSTSPNTKIYKNNAGVFTALNTTLPRVSNGSVAWGYFDYPDKLSILLSGYTGSTRITKIYMNNTPVLNQFPEAPANLFSEVNGTDVTLTWDKATDTETPQDGLSYNIFIAKTDNEFIKSPMSDPDNHGYRKIICAGNVNQCTSWTIKNMPDGLYNWSVQTIDHSFASSDFANEFTGEQLFGVSTAFTDINAGLDDIRDGSADWGDYDNDGDLDIIIVGAMNSPSFETTIIYRNDGNGMFTDINAGLIQLYAGSSDWGDYDNDGDLDVLLTGEYGVYPDNIRVSKIYRNDSGSFTDISAGLVQVAWGAAVWGDYDNDGDLDLFISGYDNSTGMVSEIYNNSSGNFISIDSGITGVYAGGADWGDYDNDGDLDIVMSGINENYDDITKIYKNDSGVFTDIYAGLTGTGWCGVAWGDYDNDGDLDLLQTGGPSKVYRNDSSSFTDISAQLISPSSGASSCSWGDYDNDGDLDIMIAFDYNQIIIYKNSEGIFSGIDFGLAGGSKSYWGDYDNDGDLDILVSGSDVSGYYTRIYRNEIGTSNTVPEPPENLSAVIIGNDVTFTWDKATDAETPQNGLSYNLYIRSDSLYAKSPMSNDSTGYRKIVNMGNINLKNSWTINNLPAGKYYWSVQAVDNAYAGSEFAAERSFIIGTLAVPSNVSISELTGNVTVSWNAVQYADSYKIYASADPYGTFDDVSSQGTFDGTSWAQSIGGDKLFYYVVAVASGK